MSFDLRAGLLELEVHGATSVYFCVATKTFSGTPTKYNAGNTLSL